MLTKQELIDRLQIIHTGTTGRRSDWESKVNIDVIRMLEYGPIIRPMWKETQSHLGRPILDACLFYGLVLEHQLAPGYTP